MQNRYAGDIGDFVKLAILRRLSAGKRLGILWWLYPDESHNADGKHISYLADPQKWRLRDPELFDALNEIVSRGTRSVASLEAANLFQDAVSFSAVLPIAGSSADRRSGRAQWFGAALKSVANCEIVFLDPDNGLETANYDIGGSKAGKSVALHELQSLREPGRSIIVYHHHTRMAGGHLFELSYWGSRLAKLGFSVDALRAAAFSARAFFLLDASPEMRKQAEAMATEWEGKLSWHPQLG